MSKKGKKSAPQDIHFDQLMRMDLDKYVRWVLSVKAGDCRPTEKTIEFFSSWRKDSFDTSMQIFKSWCEAGNPHPVYVTADKYANYLCEEMSNNYSHSIGALDENLFTNRHYDLAYLAGKIDFLKWLSIEYHSPKKVDFEFVQIFSKPQFQRLFDDLIVHLGAVEAHTKAPLVTKRKGYIKFAILRALKENNNNILSRQYSDEELLPVLNKEIGGHPCVQFKSQSKGYAQKLKEARAFINSQVTKY